ncbi:MAG: ABC transporter permease [Clostridiales bacterium]|nr:ABC transporter permease [Clostridiales bacterium]
MINILQTEFFRLKKNILFWVLLGVCAILPLLSALLELAVLSGMSAIDTGMEYDLWEIIKTSNIGGAAISSIPNLSADLQLFGLLCTSIFLCKEFSGGTFRNMLLANRSRKELYISYMLMSVTIGACYLGAEFVATLLFDGVIFGFGTMSAANVVSACILSLALGLISVIFVQSMMCMFMFSTRKLAVALACPLAISVFIPAFIFSFVSLGAQLDMISEKDLSWIPLYNLNLLDLTAIDGALIGKILLYLIPLTALFITIGWVTFRKADLK